MIKVENIMIGHDDDIEGKFAFESIKAQGNRGAYFEGMCKDNKKISRALSNPAVCNSRNGLSISVEGTKDFGITCTMIDQTNWGGEDNDEEEEAVFGHFQLTHDNAIALAHALLMIAKERKHLSQFEGYPL